MLQSYLQDSTRNEFECAVGGGVGQFRELLLGPALHLCVHTQFLLAALLAGIQQIKSANVSK